MTGRRAWDRKLPNPWQMEHPRGGHLARETPFCVFMKSDVQRGDVHVRGLAKSYGDKQVLRGLDLDVAAGTVFALIGPNGAGKTTLLELLEGLRKPDSGVAEVLGEPTRTIEKRPDLRRRLGIVLQQAALDPLLTVTELLTLYSSFYPRHYNIADLLALFSLEHRKDTRMPRLSGGELRRLDIALGIVGCPDLLFLDEPTTGLDVEGRQVIQSAVREFSAAGMTVVLTTHYLEEVTALADAVGLLVEGSLVFAGSPASFIEKSRLERRIEFTLPQGWTGQVPDGSRVQEGTLSTPLDEESINQTLRGLTSWADTHRLPMLDLRITSPTLENAYLAVLNDVRHVAAVVR